MYIYISTLKLLKVWLKCPNAFLGQSVNLRFYLKCPLLCPYFHKYTNCNRMCPQMPFGTCLSDYIHTACLNSRVWTIFYPSLLNTPLLASEGLDWLQRITSAVASWAASRHYVSLETFKIGMGDATGLLFDSKYCPISNTAKMSFLNEHDKHYIM